jgi:hypothetical protein
VLTSKCPDCRASFDLVLPDLTYLPEKYHKFVTHNVRRVYVDFSSPNKELRESLKAAEDRLARKAATEQALLKRCEALGEALSVHRQGERDANQRILELQDDNAHMEKLVEENSNLADEIQGMHRIALDKVKCLEKSNEALRQENLSFSLDFHNLRREFLKNKEWMGSKRGDTSSNQTSDLLSQSTNTSSVALHQRKCVVQLPQGDSAGSSSEDDASFVISTSRTTKSSIRSASTSKPIVPSRRIKPLPKRRRNINRILGDTSFMSIDLSDFV